MSRLSKHGRARRDEAIKSIGRILRDVAGAITPWDTVEAELATLSPSVAVALAYRLERAQAGAFEDGMIHERHGVAG